MAKDWEEYSPYKQEKLAKELGEQFGIDRDKYQEEDRGSQGNFDSKGYNQAIADAMANDYDTRRSIEAAGLAGEYDGPKGISKIGEAYKVHNFLKDTHESMGNSGKFSSANDYAGVAHHWVNKDRERFTDDLTGMTEKLLDDALSRKSDKEDGDSSNDGPVEQSERLGGARDRLDAAANDPSALYEKNNQNVSKTDDQKDGARNFLDDKKKELAQGLNLQSDIKNNLTNSASFLTGSYMG